MAYEVFTKGWEKCIPKEAEAGEAITPGQGVTRQADGTLETGGDDGALLVAHNRGEVGMDKTDSYDAGEYAKFAAPVPGVELEVPFNDEPTDGTVVELADDGNFQTHDTGTAVGKVVGEGDTDGRYIIEVK